MESPMDLPARVAIANRTGGCVVGNDWRTTAGESLIARSPIDGTRLATLHAAHPADVATAVDAAQQAFLRWRVVPAPRRGEFVRRLGDRFRARKAELAELITPEVGKIPHEALGG